MEEITQITLRGCCFMAYQYLKKAGAPSSVLFNLLNASEGRKPLHPWPDWDGSSIYETTPSPGEK